MRNLQDAAQATIQDRAAVQETIEPCGLSGETPRIESDTEDQSQVSSPSDGEPLWKER